MKNSGRYNLRKRIRNVEENSARKRIKIKSDTESDDEDFSPDDSSRESEEDSDEDSGEEDSGEDDSGEDDSGEDDSGEETGEDSGEETEEDSCEETEEEVEIPPYTFRSLGYGYRPGESLDSQEGKDNFFEPDTENLSNEITNHVMKKFSKLGLPKKELKKAVESSMKRARSDVFDEYCDSKPKDKRWKVGLDKDTVQTLGPELKKLRLDIQNEKPTIFKILAAKIPRVDKKKALELFNILENIDQYSKERLEIEEEIRTILSIENEIGDDLERYEREEAKLKDMVGNHDAFLKQQIFDLDATDEVKSRIYEMYLDMASRPTNDSEYNSIKNKIMWAVSIPHGKMVHPKDTLKEVYTRFDEKLYGLKHVKERAIEIFNNRQSNPGTRSMLALKGPPGVGKCLGKDTPVMLYDGFSY